MGGDGCVRVHGRLSDGQRVDYTLDSDARIGTEVAAGWWAKGCVAGGGLLLSRGSGYRVENAILPPPPQGGG